MIIFSLISSVIIRAYKRRRKGKNDKALGFHQAVKPRYLVPIHYQSTKGAFLTEPYPSPKDPEQYLGELTEKMKEKGITTQVLILYPGQEIELMASGK